MALLETFAEIERELGRRVFEAVVERARLAVAAEVMVEAERRAIRRTRTLPCSPDGKVISFPTRAHGREGVGDA
ncbi:hypothetical protein ACXR8U_09375 [Methylobacterium radiotolerans]|nr:hypothetical protein [Methylobacterium organophilum]